MAETVEDEVGDVYSQNIFILEKELGAAASTYEDSLLLKFFSQIENLQKYREAEEKQMEKSQSGKGTFR